MMKKDFIEYCEKHVLLIVLTFIIIFVCHGYILNNSNVGIDTEIFLNNPEKIYFVTMHSMFFPEKILNF